MIINLHSMARVLSIKELENEYKNNDLDGIYLIKINNMTYTGLIRNISNGTIFMDLPLKFSRNDNPMYTPTVIEPEEFRECKEVPLEGHIRAVTKKDGIIEGDIMEVYNNRIIIKADEIKTVYYQDLYDVD